MEEAFCPSCRRITGYKRSLGWGTFFGALFTFGLSLLLIPSYPKRCVVCGGKVQDGAADLHFEAPPEPRVATKTCPDCAEEIKIEARACRFCGRQFESPQPTEVAEPESEPTAQRFGDRWGDLNTAWQAAIIHDHCPRCNTSPALEIQGADFRCKTCGAVFPRPGTHPIPPSALWNLRILAVESTAATRMLITRLARYFPGRTTSQIERKLTALPLLIPCKLSRDTATAVQRKWAELGISVEVVPSGGHATGSEGSWAREGDHASASYRMGAVLGSIFRGPTWYRRIMVVMVLLVFLFVLGIIGSGIKLLSQSSRRQSATSSAPISSSPEGSSPSGETPAASPSTGYVWMTGERGEKLLCPEILHIFPSDAANERMQKRLCQRAWERKVTEEQVERSLGAQPR